MASSSAHPAFPRNYNTHLGNIADRSKNTAFGASTTAQQRERLDRERLEKERLEKEKLGREGQDHMSQLTEEQREEINEAVRLLSSF